MSPRPRFVDAFRANPMLSLLMLAAVLFLGVGIGTFLRASAGIQATTRVAKCNTALMATIGIRSEFAHARIIRPELDLETPEIPASLIVERCREYMPPDYLVVLEQEAERQASGDS